MDRLSEVLRNLASENIDLAEDARYELQNVYGTKALSDVLEIIPQLNNYSRLCAIDYIQRCDIEEIRKEKHKVAAVMLPLLKNDGEVTREWTAIMLGMIRDLSAIPSLQQAQAMAKKRGIPLDSGEQSAYRWALTKLGARRVVIPEHVMALNRSSTIGDFDFAWEITDAPIAIEGLSNANQVILFLKNWIEKANSKGEVNLYGEDCPNYELDLSVPWPQLVSNARAAALDAVKKVLIDKPSIITLEWIDEADR